MVDSVEVRLVLIDRGNWRRCLEVQVAGEQLGFVADHQPIALVVLAKSYVGVGGWDWEPLAIESNGGEIVGVLGLAHDADGSQLFNMAVDHLRQRSDIGTAALAAVIDRCRARGSSHLSLTVNPDNRAALALYQRAGFTFTGEEQDGEPVLTVHL